VVIETVMLLLQWDRVEYAWQVNYWPGHCNTFESHYTYDRIPSIMSDVIMLNYNPDAKLMVASTRSQCQARSHVYL